MTALTLGRVLMRLNVSLIQLKKGKFIALSAFGREIVTLTIFPSSSSSNLSVCNDIKGKVISFGYKVVYMKNEMEVTRNIQDQSIIISQPKPYFSLIWLHGLGDTSQGFLDYFQMKDSPAWKGGRVILLQAPERAVTINDGDVCNSWYDIKTESEEGTDDEKYSIEEIKESLAIIRKAVEREIAFWRKIGVEGSDESIWKRIFLGGFSQGCAMSLCYGLSSTFSLAGIIGLSGDLFQSFDMKNKDLVPMLVFHGDSDDVIDFRSAKRLYDKHLGGSACFDFRLIPDLFHGVNKQELQAFTKWIIDQLSQQQIKP